MHNTKLLILALSAFSSALPTVASRKACLHPSTFTISDFTTFTPDGGNTAHPATVFFTISDDSNPGKVRCSRSGEINSLQPTICSDGKTVFRWFAGALTVGSTYTSCASSSSAHTFGDLHLELNCYNSVPPMPNGHGIECQTPTGQVSGQFSRGQL